MKHIGIMTSGGDSPGMNAAVEALARGAAVHGLTPFGVQEGFSGLLAGRILPLTPDKVNGICGWGGTVLGSARPEGLNKEEGLAALAGAARAAALDALVVLGGDGSLGYVAARLDVMGVPCIGIPCTIDNDVPETEYTLGFDSACAYALAVVDAMRQTARSLSGRVFVLETLGGVTGHLALAIAHGVQADAVAIPETAPDWAALGQRLSEAVETAGHALLVMSEGVGWQFDFERELAPHLPHRIRHSSLGHAQRGATPTYWDRVTARIAGETALDTLAAGRTGCMLAWQGGRLVEVPLAAVATGKRPPDLGLYTKINGLFTGKAGPHA